MEYFLIFIWIFGMALLVYRVILAKKALRKTLESHKYRS
jgi:tellurite resistance protein TehA-like permease